jgi:excisionase family DNA binding protein
MDAARQLERLVTVRQASRITGVPRHLLYRAAEAGEIEVLDIGSWPRVRLSAVERWLATQRRVPRGAA